MSSPTNQVPAYECDICGDDVPESEGVLACESHIYCNDCAIQTFHRSLINIDEFPASCCPQSRNGLPPSLFQDLLGPVFMDKYRTKLHEHYTPEPIRVYCANARCAVYHHPRTFDDSDHRWTVVACGCGTTTCVGCKAEWVSQHVCEPTDPSKRPDWLPMYSAECRIKQCPQCAEWIQLPEACNHMECSSCHHEFCFVCLLHWENAHAYQDYPNDRDCPLYGDPLCGYDGEGFEKSARGLHMYTGRDGDGYDRTGLDVLGQPREYRPRSADTIEQRVADLRAALETMAANIRLPALRESLVGSRARNRRRTRRSSTPHGCLWKTGKTMTKTNFQHRTRTQTTFQHQTRTPTQIWTRTYSMKTAPQCGNARKQTNHTQTMPRPSSPPTKPPPSDKYGTRYDL